MEVAKAFGIPWDRWQALPEVDKAEHIAHEIERATREGYDAEKAISEGKEKAPGAYEQAMARYGIG